MSKPNILFVIVDELRYPPCYETSELTKWRKDNLVFNETIKNNGVEFTQHYTNTNACVPSRTTLQTGVYPSVHGSISTDAVAKTSDEPDMKWLKPHIVPTIGNYMEEIGYLNILKGKWHLTDDSIKGESGEYLQTFDIDGYPIPEMEQFYIDKDVLKLYGYHGWVGPEPHGRYSINSASSVYQDKIGRDEKIVRQTIDSLDYLDKQNDPWLLCTNLIDPHDITLFGAFTLGTKLGFNFEMDPTLPDKLYTDDFLNSLNDDLRTKPPAQKSYRYLYEKAFQPHVDLDQHWRYYLTLMKRVDSQLMRIWNKLISTDSYKNTIIICTSDHGELLGSHNYMFQKWHQAYQEAIHIPLVISSPLYGNKSGQVNSLTSHIDILPTIIDMTNTDYNYIRRKLFNRFKLAVPLSGSSLVPFIDNTMNQSLVIRPVYFYTEDQPTKGTNQITVTGCPYKAVIDPACVEAIISYVKIKEHHPTQLWKYTSYYSTNPKFIIDQSVNHELYNLSSDPIEVDNLYNNPNYNLVQSHLANLLITYSFKFKSMI